MAKILAIDDKPEILKVLASLIKKLLPEIRFLGAISAEDGISIARRELPDVILLDVVMPILDGFETCRIIKTDEAIQHIPVIMITAVRTDVQSRIKGLCTLNWSIVDFKQNFHNR